MINLLPTDVKQEISYARLNTILRNWIIAALVGLTGIGLIVGGGLLYMQKNINDYSKQITASKENLKTQNVEATQKRVEDISASTKLSVQVLSREILFSKLIRQVGSALPAETSLVSLEIDNLQGGLQLDAAAADFNAGTQLQLNLQDPKNGVFEKADINSIECSGASKKDVKYPCKVNLRALFSKNNSYVYIAPAEKKQ